MPLLKQIADLDSGQETSAPLAAQQPDTQTFNLELQPTIDRIIQLLQDDGPVGLIAVVELSVQYSRYDMEAEVVRRLEPVHQSMSLEEAQRRIVRATTQLPDNVAQLVPHLYTQDFQTLLNMANDDAALHIWNAIQIIAALTAQGAVIDHGQPKSIEN